MSPVPEGDVLVERDGAGLDGGNRPPARAPLTGQLRAEHAARDKR